MRPEYLHIKYPTGGIEVITGPMFSGKTEELIRRLKRAVIAKQKVVVFKHELDKRYSEENIQSHDENYLQSTSISRASEIYGLMDNAGVVGIDEAQFFEDDLITVCNTLANKGVRVIVAGLDMNYRAEPFGIMPALMACAEQVSKLQAVCIRCGNPAFFSYKLDTSDDVVLIGAKGTYEPLCRKCFYTKK